jgi:hypothetical protein
MVTSWRLIVLSSHFFLPLLVPGREAVWFLMSIVLEVVALIVIAFCVRDRKAFGDLTDLFKNARRLVSSQLTDTPLAPLFQLRIGGSEV